MGRTVCVVATLAVLGVGQTAHAGDWWLGVRGGPSIPRLTSGGNEVSTGYSSILAPNIGVMDGYRLSALLAVVIEVDYSGQGGERKGFQPITQMPEGTFPAGMLPAGQYLYADFDNKSVLSYLEVPVLAKYECVAAGNWNGCVAAGPYVGLLINAQQRTRGTAQIYADAGRTQTSLAGYPLPEVSFDADTDVEADLNKTNWGVTAGAGVGYALDGASRLFLDVRGEYGVRSIQQDKVNGESNTGCALFLLGYERDFGNGG